MRVRGLIPLLALAFTAALSSCSKDADFDLRPGPGGSAPAVPRDDTPAGSYGKVFLMVSGGHNDLSHFLTTDQRDMEQGWLPGAGDKDVLVFLSRVLGTPGFANVTTPVLYRMYRREDGSVRRDTLHRWGPDDRLFAGNVIHDALDMVHRRFPAGSYGMVVSSHGTGWMPVRYYYNPQKFEDALVQEAVPRPRSVGQDDDGSESLEMSLPDFIAAIPYRLDYLLLDCCLCGGVEVAWGLRGKADLVGFSQAEILADGFDYKKIVSRLLEGETPDARAVCEDYFARYDNPKNPTSGSATISLVDTREMDALAEVCSTLFSKYRTQLSTLDGSEDWDGWKVQGYFRYDRHYFYDLEDILIQVGITDEEHDALTAALNRCVLYKAATPWFMYGSFYAFRINIHSGFSMYLPSMGTPYLNSYYKDNMSWNDASGLVP